MKLFGRSRKSAAHGPLCNKTVQVGKNTVLCESLLGSGGYADIYRVTDLASGATYALKHLRLNGDPTLIQEVQREAKTQARLKGHPNVLRLHAVAFAGPRGGETDGFFLLDFCPGNLLDLLARHNYLLEQATALHIFGCVARAVAHMHAQSPPMAHRDLKAENVLMLPDGTWVLCDYGSATQRAQVYETAEAMAAEEEVIRKHTTPAYRPPEMWDLYQRQLIDTKVDIWALGVLLFVLCFGRLPFAGDSKLQILNGKYDMPPTPSRAPQLRALIRAMLALDPAQRPDIRQVLQQLDQAALAITGKPLPAPPAAAAAPVSSGQPGISAAAAAPQPPAAQSAQQQAVTQQQQQQQQQREPPQPPQQHTQQHTQQQQAPRLQQPPAAAVGGGSFWSTSDVAGCQQQHSSTTAGSSSSASTQQQQQHHQQQQWAQFGGAEASQPQHAVQRLQQQQQGGSSPQGSPVTAAAGAAANISNGHVSIAPARQQGGSNPGHVQAGPDMSRLADITARAQAAAAAQKSQTGAVGQQQQQQQHAAASAAGAGPQAEPPVLFERQSRPYSLGSTAGSATGTPTASTAGASQLAGNSFSGSRVANVPAAADKCPPPPPPSSEQPHWQQQQQQQQPPARSSSSASGSGAPSRPVPAAAAASAVPAGAADAGSFVGSSNGASGSGTAARAAATPAAAASAVPAGAAAAPLPQQLAALRASVLGEVEALRGQVAALSDQNQAFVFRIKQLEDYAQRQEAAVARLSQQLADLQQQQQQQQGCNNSRTDGVSSAAGSGSGAACVARRRSDGAAADGQAGMAGGSFWSTQSAVL
uniref:non-specific serine/threonine protein kinase n=1 Tax=Tetradesmus obliquus TaxID=3088 RepID=A0A383WGG4_TETOB|eukprot:jgi/Sobl393_1/1844/SZX76199.1